MSSHLKLSEVRDYLKRCGSRKNPLTRARKQELIDAREFDLQAVNTCDFCGLPLSEVSYERLNDGAKYDAAIVRPVLWRPQRVRDVPQS